MKAQEVAPDINFVAPPLVVPANDAEDSSDDECIELDLLESDDEKDDVEGSGANKNKMDDLKEGAHGANRD